ncbi:MAG: hypothetical protein Q9225_004520 [Loekoesia sp. 1 TL-2023]
MAKSSPVLELLAADGEPMERAYQNVCNRIIHEPQIVHDLVSDQHSSDLLFCVARHSDRLSKLLDRLFARRHQRSGPFPLEAIAIATITLFKHLVSNTQAIGVTRVVNCLVPALSTCIASKVPHVRGLATALICQDTIVEYLLAQRAGANAISLWTSSPVSHLQDAATLKAWTDKLINVVKLCATDHGLTAQLHEWRDLNKLKDLLSELDHKHTAQCARHKDPQNPSDLRHMIKLDSDQKKSQITQHRDSTTASLEVSMEVSDLLKNFDLEIPGSSRKLTEIIERLETEKTLGILRAAVVTFPCRLCNVNLHGEPRGCQNVSIASDAEDVFSWSKFNMDVFGTSLKDCNWEILLSSSALSTLQRRQQSKTASSIEGTLKILASGDDLNGYRVGPKSAKRNFKVPVLSTRCERHLYIIWQIDLDVDRKSRKLNQVIRVWGITKKARISKVLEHVVAIQSTWTEEKISRCYQRSGPIGKKIIPVTFEDDSISIEPNKSRQVRLDVRSMDQDSLGLISKFYAFTEPAQQSRILTSMAPELPYQLSRHEMDIVCRWETPSLILGRSGTGKTTCLMFKLIGKYLASKSPTNQRTIKQVLLTRSRHLADQLRKYVRRSIQTLSTGSLDNVPFEGETSESLEINVSTSDVLALNDSVFPYVCTFEDFLRLLENTVAITDRSRIRMHRLSRFDILDDLSDVGHCVDFEAFKLDYWPQLPRNITSQLPLSLVYAEIMGVIKGSASSINSSDALNYEEYLHRSSRIAPAFTLESERSLVYEAFQRYEVLKRGRCEVDYVDRVVDVLQAIQTDTTLQRMLSSVIDEIYVDEIQDQRCVDIKLFFHLLKDSRGFHAAGDTAQSISQDSNFRFADIKALLYDHFKAIDSSKNRRALTDAMMFKLGLNYRSQDGIVGFAGLVMELLWKAFPRTIDKLEPEFGQLQGPTPIIFVDCEPDVLARVKLNSTDLPGSTASFGAKQVVLVRDDKTKARLLESVGDIGLVLTILQSKGMEFNSVILFDFLTSCPDPSGLRALPALLDADLERFDPTEHPAMCTELKHLYVAATRARNRLSLFETGTEKDLSCFMRMLTQHAPQPVIRIVNRADPSFDEEFKLLSSDSSSNPQHWIENGESLMSNGEYQDAYDCFERAAFERGMNLAMAKRKYADGRTQLTSGDTERATESFEAAAALFLRNDLYLDAIRALCAIGRYERAATLRFERNQYDQAAQLFARAHLYIKAAECHDRVGNHEEAARVLWEGKEYDSLVRYVTEHRGSIPEKISNAYGTKCIFPLKQNKISPRYRKEAISLLGAFKERERIFRQFDMHEALDELYGSEGRIKDLFELRLQKGNLENALQLLTSKKTVKQLSGVPQDKIHLLIDYIITGRLTASGRRKKQVQPKVMDDMQKLTVPGHGNRVRQWKVSLDCLANSHQTLAPHLMAIEDERLRFVVALLVLNPESIGSQRSFDSLLSDTLQEAIAVVKDVVMKDEVTSVPSLLTVCHCYNGRQCHQKHEHVSQETFSVAIKERLVREITWVSAFEQDDAALKNTLQQILFDKSLATVAAGTEALLFYRLEHEWRERKKQLMHSAAAYKGKNPLMIFQKGSTQSSLVRSLRIGTMLKTITLDEVLTSISAIKQNQASHHQASDTDMDSDDRLTLLEINSLKKLQQRWRVRSAQIRGQRLLMQSSKHRQIARFQQLTIACSPLVRVHLRFLFITRGVDILADLSGVQTRFSVLHNAITSAIDNATEASYEKINEALSRGDIIRETLATANDNVSDINLKLVIDNGDHEEMEAYLEWVGLDVERAKGEVVEVEELLKEAAN